jgi:prepilin-type processing-associated H-X9-DG protein
LYCPSRRAVRALPSGSTLTGRTDYVANGGNFYLPNGGTTFNGIVGIGSHVTDAMITDTRETTYLVGEKYMSPENYMSGNDTTPGNPGYDPGDLGCAMSGDDKSLIRWGSVTFLPILDQTSNKNPPLDVNGKVGGNSPYIFGSAHGAGWHAAFCDGHVQLIGWGIDPKTHQTMASRNGVRKLKYDVVDPTLIGH